MATVVIIGAGIMGTSIAYHLAERGCADVVILEKEPTEIRGSTARAVAGVRHQFSTEVNVQLSLYSIERLKHFTEEIGGYAELHQVGYLFLISDPVVWQQYQQNVAMQQRLGARVELLKPEDVADMIPETAINDLLGATFGSDDGYCDAHGVASGYLKRARELGVQLQRETVATGFQLHGDRVVAVETNGQKMLPCEFVVNAAGPWAGAVAELAGLPAYVKPYRRCVYMTEPFSDISHPIPLTVDVTSGFYMRKELDNILFGMSNLAEPSSYNMMMDWEWLDTVLTSGLRRFPILERAGLAEKLCWVGLYEMTPDAMPILGRHPELSNYVDASGFSGHGIMHAPATGRLIAEEILDGCASMININDLRTTRFSSDVLVKERNVI
ncbi:MAG: FAD-binding oxidoreductase [Chloroflexi bacterium AL-W]|nr:FAD-binding oxidoreductase [Chloroflexi bacterium AL-N1]NOK65719.1 FAD-binding oxidoreductase [Chloroflexi bacterium AL-N10]NOK74340.1 FAD-binding oxidoreductase [Chloroflexi bacterium AL-N5]NOK80752.1 FAD-binding oxidoreductase [Chloroflexi bacterium AL-W]NOK88598.1 FAD-binding oxidoreductase [Chloroflexi bacterium AL-N15]